MTWVEHADGVFSRRYASLDLNIGAIRCDGGLLIIDTRANHRQARELTSDLKSISRLPVRWVINTHHHWDHTFGNGEFFEADIWGHELCARHLADQGHSMLARVKALAPDQAEAFDEVLIEPPAFTVSESTEVEFGGRLVELHYLGRGHTDNDLVIRLPGVVFAGDLIENGAPPSFGDAFTLEWPDTARRLADLIDGAVIPGHGAPAGRAFVETQAQELAEVARLAVTRHADGLTVGAAANRGGPYPNDTMLEAFRRAWAHLGPV